MQTSTVFALIALCSVVACTQLPTTDMPKETPAPIVANAASVETPSPAVAAAPAPVAAAAEPAPPLPPTAAAALGIAPAEIESTTSIDPPPSAPSPAPAPSKLSWELAPRPYTDVWEHIRSGFKMPDIDDEVVRKWENFYASRPEYWQRINERGKRYLYFITAEIEQRQMPMEIALLPIIESAYNPSALSRARASGIWQFVPATGKIYGLQQNWWLDNRRDVTMATAGALDYLERLYAKFDDWQLALASYNAGAATVEQYGGIPPYPETINYVKTIYGYYAELVRY